MENVAITLTLTTFMSFLALLVGGMIGWLARQHHLEQQYVAYTHPEMFDQNGNVIPDEIVAVRFENENDDDEEDE
jgi:hypothetical protein|tara:strand:+ start:907 stop:1131 length:225 start_codon:yes stop_codon:yes gene_type:complete